MVKNTSMEKNQNPEKKNLHSFVGPKALFDPFFIPSKLINRKKEEQYLGGLLNDALFDEFPVNIGLYGIQGVGKTVLINKTINSLIEKTGKKNETESEFMPLYVSCEGKDLNQILFTIINSLADRLSVKLDPVTILQSHTATLWNLAKALITKTNISTILVMDAVEYVNPEIMNKLMNFAKNEKILLLNSFNIAQSSPFLMDFKRPDFKLRLGFYNHNDLFEIGKDRCNSAIRTPVDSDILRYSVDLISDFDKRVPGSLMRVLREIYPMLTDGSQVSGDHLRDICRYQFEGYSIDELSVADFITNADMVDRLFLDNIYGYFNGREEYYIPYNELKTRYSMACESYEEPLSNRKFNRSLSNLQKISLLLPSNISNNLMNESRENSYQYENPLIRQEIATESNYYLTVQPELINDMLNVVFGNY